MIFIRYRKIPVISPGAYICSKGLFVIFLETLYGILVEECVFSGEGGGAYYRNFTVFIIQLSPLSHVDQFTMSQPSWSLLFNGFYSRTLCNYGRLTDIESVLK